jgi:hypothetical protein
MEGDGEVDMPGPRVEYTEGMKHDETDEVARLGET